MGFYPFKNYKMIKYHVKIMKKGVFEHFLRKGKGLGIGLGIGRK
jgi:hypothetical protein